MLFCPECYSQYRKRERCACEAPFSKHIMFCAPGELPLVCGHLTSLDDTPRPNDLLEQICDGPLLHPAGSSTQSHCCCGRHKANTFWVWQGNSENLPPVGTVPQHEKTPLKTLLFRIMPVTGLLLIEAPQSTPLFLAHFARNKIKGSAPTDFSVIIDRLRSVFEFSAPRKRAIALLDPASSSSSEDRKRLAVMSESFSVFADRAEAFRWLLNQGLQSSGNFRCVPRDHVTTDVNLGAREPANPNPSKVTKIAALPLVGLVDIGGIAGRQLLARIHRETYRAKVTAEPDDPSVALPGSRWSLGRLRAGSTAKKLNYGHIHELRNGHLAPGSSVPTWHGERVRWRWLGVEPFTLALQDASTMKNYDSLIIGLGDSRFFGQRELASLLEQIWRGSCLPAAVIRADRVNPDLLRWLRNEFPRTPEFPDSWDGGMQAVETALRAATRRPSA